MRRSAPPSEFAWLQAKRARAASRTPACAIPDAAVVQSPRAQLSYSKSRAAVLLGGLLVLQLAGCGTTRWTDTPRSATEQLLISTAVDKAINRLDFSALAGQKVFFDPQYLVGVTDERYIVSTFRQHLFAQGCYLSEKREDAEYVVEARSGAVGTDRNELLFGTPSVPVPLGIAPGIPASIPQVTLGKNTKQRAVAKLAVYAFNRQTGRPVWQSGAVPTMTDANDTWFLGAGPFRKGSITNSSGAEPSKTKPALRKPTVMNDPSATHGVNTTEEAFFSGQTPLGHDGAETAEPGRLPADVANRAARLSSTAEPSRSTVALASATSDSPTTRTFDPKVEVDPQIAEGTSEADEARRVAKHWMFGRLFTRHPPESGGGYQADDLSTLGILAVGYVSRRSKASG